MTAACCIGEYLQYRLQRLHFRSSFKTREREKVWLFWKKRFTDRTHSIEWIFESVEEILAENRSLETKKFISQEKVNSSRTEVKRVFDREFIIN